jgi:hypothetical protein
MMFPPEVMRGAYRVMGTRVRKGLATNKGMPPQPGRPPH